LVSIVTGILLPTACKKDNPIQEINNNNIPYNENGNDTININANTDFILTKSTIGQTLQNATSSILSKGFVKSDGDRIKFTLEQNGITKTLSLFSSYENDKITNAEMTVRNQNTDTLKMVLTQWLSEFKDATNFSLITRDRYTTKADATQKTYSDVNSLMVDINSLHGENTMSISVYCVDKNAYQYSIDLWFTNYSKMVSMQIIKSDKENVHRATFSNEIVGRHKHILLMKVDYLTFNYLGYTTIDVADKTASGDTIPFLAEYYPPCDFGNIKLYYNNKNDGNKLFEGSIIWMGCGKMDFPTEFWTGNSQASTPYPGQNKINMINTKGGHVIVADEHDLKFIWETISARNEFQWFYSHSSKKIAVYQYQPSVGIGDPADGYYLVFVEQNI
ncbi:MAG: hypothetical protein J5606_00005, partial [Bacteroidales bacterium]|nr:hypothetical protein [Bacteroidales bacterium]